METKGGAVTQCAESGREGAMGIPATETFVITAAQPRDRRGAPIPSGPHVRDDPPALLAAASAPSPRRDRTLRVHRCALWQSRHGMLACSQQAYSDMKGGAVRPWAIRICICVHDSLAQEVVSPAGG